MKKSIKLLSLLFVLLLYFVLVPMLKVMQAKQLKNNYPKLKL